MTDQSTVTSKSKPKTSPMLDAPKLETAKFETPKFEIPKFDMPNMEVPAAFREFAEKGIAQAKQNYDKMKSVAEEATDVMEDTYSTASKGACDYGLKVVENTRANTNAAFDLMGALFGAKTFAEAVELSTGYMRVQFDTLTAQAKDLSACAQKVGTETIEPIKNGFSNAMKKAA